MDLESLRREYAQPATRDDRLIKLELDNIAQLLQLCEDRELKYAEAITDKFCQVVERMKAQHARELADAAIPWDPEGAPERKDFVAYPSAACAYEDPEALLVAFYNHFRNDQKKRSRGEKQEYPTVRTLEELKGGDVNPTMRDYVARVRTFAKRYLADMPRVRELWDKACEEGQAEPVLFTYQHLELILASFETRDVCLYGDGGNVANKQKLNLRSALRKFNEFKRQRETQ